MDDPYIPHWTLDPHTGPCDETPGDFLAGLASLLGAEVRECPGCGDARVGGDDHPLCRRCRANARSKGDK